jgi:hypothetical protein
MTTEEYTEDLLTRLDAAQQKYAQFPCFRKAVPPEFFENIQPTFGCN